MKKGETTFYTPAARWKRILAYIFDMSLINLLAVLPFKSALESYSTYTLAFSKIQDPTLYLSIIIIFSLSLFYFITLELNLSQTLGKMLFKIKTVSTQGQLTFKQTLLRNLTKPFPLLLFVDSLYTILKSTHQRLFERLSDTEVIEA